MEINVVEIVFMLLGGLALFIYGMNLMGESLQKAAGERMRKILEALTKNPLIGILVGLVTTALVQSSSATTVMVIGFVSARLMTLPQAISVIMGANIGTTLTAQIIAFKVGKYAYLVAAIGFTMSFAFKKKIFKYLGQAIFAFGLLFIGLNIMGDVMSPLAKSQIFADTLLKLSDHNILGILVGILSTVVVQSSSAVIAVIQNLSSQASPDGVSSVLGLGTAIPLLLGSNIGTTITALLASIGGRINAKRTAVAHLVFNGSGTILMLFFIPAFKKLVEIVSPKGEEVVIISRQIANAHTMFNVLNTILWFPFIWLLAKIVMTLVKGEDDGVEHRVRYLDYRMIKNPSIAMNLATRELARMAEMAQKMMASARRAFINADMDEAKNAQEIEDTIDLLQTEIVKYLSVIMSTGSLTEKQSVRMAGLMHVTNDIERIGDHCENISEFATWKKEENIPFSNEALEEVGNAFNVVNKMVDDSIHALRNGDVEMAKKILGEEKEVDMMEEELRNSHLERLNKGLCNPKSAVIYIELIHNLERIADHCNNIAEAVLKDYNIEPEMVLDAGE